jgi:hypothetical protein
VIWLGPIALLLAIARELQAADRWGDDDRLDSALQAEADRQALTEAVVARAQRISLAFSYFATTRDGREFLHLDSLGGGRNWEDDRIYREMKGVFEDVVGAHILGSGVSRVALVVRPRDESPGFVLKVPRWNSSSGWPGDQQIGHGDNLAEAQLWTQVVANDHPLKDLLVPIRLFADDGSWVVMEHVERAVYEDNETVLPVQMRLRQLGVGDQHKGNLGFHDGQIKSFDYANNAVRLPEQIATVSPDTYRGVSWTEIDR